ncbi:MAG: NAD(P)-binding domain-containing protein [Woeseiaceae bacterium]|nr:NAD(P)-binding domain-containing protein [Woeseiaceae bacterium]
MRIILCLIVLLATSASADTIAIIGTGDVARALGPAFAQQGHTIVYGSREPGRESVRSLVKETGTGASATLPTAAVVDADFVVLAVPGLLVGEITRGLGNLDGKIIIDPTNPLEFEPLTLRHEDGLSNAELIQSIAPNAHVVKAFNTLNWRVMVEPELAGGPVSVPLVANDADAKLAVAKLVMAMGLDPIDVGDLQNARWVEGLSVLLLNNMIKQSEPFNIYLRRSP